MTSAPSGRTSPTPPALSAADLRRWAFRAEAALKAYRRRLDALNVFPVPDGDTGTNLYLTLHSALEGLVGGYLARAPAIGVVSGTQALAQHMLFSARGNSGVILSQLLRGLADALEAAGRQDPAREPVIDGASTARMFAAASRAARRAVSEPVEGTILTVADAAADGAQAAAAAGDGLAEVVDAAFASADAALARTPGQLPPLARAGVVDAGGAGLLVLLGVLADVIHGRPADHEGYPGTTPWWVGGVPATPRGVEQGRPRAGAYEVMYLLEGTADEDADRLRVQLLRLGDSVMVVGDARLRTVHVHVDDVGAAVEPALGLGKMSGVRVSWLGDANAAARSAGEPGSAAATEASADGAHQVGECPVARGWPAGLGVPIDGAPKDGVPIDGVPIDGVPIDGIGAVACAPGPGLAAGYGRAGARVIDSRPGGRATTGLILEAILATGRDGVVVLPNDDDAMLAAQSAARLAADRGIGVRVIPTSSPLQGLAAMAVLDPAGDLADNVERMTEAAATVRCGRVAVATRPARTEAGECRAGDVLGFVGDAVVTIDADAVELTLRLLERLGTADAEFVTLASGREDPGLGERVATRLASRHPDVEVTCIDGGQPVDVLLVGVE